MSARCIPLILADAECAQNRQDYQKLCALLSKLASFGGGSDAQQLIAQLREVYPRRGAMQDELDRVEPLVLRASGQV